MHLNLSRCLTSAQVPSIPAVWRSKRSSGMRMLFLLFSLSGILLSSCADSTPDTISGQFLAAETAVERDTILSEVQGNLLNEESISDANLLIKAAERQRVVEGRLIRESIDLSSSTINYYSVNPMAALSELGTLGISDQSVEIIDFGPEGLMPIENRQPRIYVMFNQPMVPIAKLGEPIVESPILRIEPPVPGTFRWYGTRTLSFEPDVPLLEHPVYRVEVSAGTQSLGGGTLPQSFSFSLYPERLELIELYPGTPENRYFSNFNVPPAYAAQYVLEFNQDIDPEILSPSISVKVNNREVPFTFSRPDYPEQLSSRTERALHISLVEAPEANQSVDISIAEGAVPFEGFPPSQAESVTRIRTLYPFRVLQFSSAAGNFPMNNSSYIYPVYLRFSHPLEDGAARLSWGIQVDGEPVTPDSIEASGSTVRFGMPDIRPGQVVNVNIPPDLEDVYGRVIAEGARVGDYEIPRPYPFFNMPGQRTSLLEILHLESEFEPLIAYSFRNQENVRIGSAAFREGVGLSEQYQDIELVDADLSQIPDDEVRFELLDISPYLNPDGFGAALYRWESIPQSSDNRRVRTDSDDFLVFRTDIGITVRVAYNKILVWANRLSDGSPVTGAVVEVLGDVFRYPDQEDAVSGTTDETGLAVIDLDQGWRYRSLLNIRVRSGNDTALLRVASTQNHWRFGINSYSSPSSILDHRHAIQMFTDRGLYQAGEELAFRGIHWTIDEEGYFSQSRDYRVVITSRRGGRVVWSSEGTTSESGGFSHRIRLPEDLDSGDYIISYRVDRIASGYHSFYVTNFRRAAFQVTSSINDRRILVGESINAQVEASYLSGGNLPAAEYRYLWTRRPVNFRPQGTQWEDWIFGNSRYASERIMAEGNGRLTSSGSARISIATEGSEVPAKPYSYILETRVEDIDRQEIASRVEVLVHPHDEYIAARLVSGSTQGWWSRFIPTKAEATARVQLVGIDGEALQASGEVGWSLIHRVWKSVQQEGLYGRLNNRWEQIEEEVGSGSVRLADGSADLKFTPEESGQYILRFTRSGPAGRSNETEIAFYATGSGWVQTASQTPSDIELVVDKPEYQVGETARILIQSPVPAGRYLLTVERSGILEERVLQLESGTEVIEIEVKEEYLPVFYVALSSYTSRGDIEPDYFKPDLGKPRGLFGITSVLVSTDPVELDVAIEEAVGAYGPGDEVELKVRVSKDGQPVSGAEVTLLAVDRGVLDLINYHIPNPLEFFYHPRNFPLAVFGDDSRRLLLRPVTYDISTLQGGDGVKMEERDDFNPLAFFEPMIVTDDQGYATATFTLPDTLTTYRVTAVTMAGTRLGLDESEFMVQNPVNMRSALPRQFRNRDTAAAGVVLTNLSAEAVDVEVSVESDILSLPGDTTKSITLEPDSVTELPFVLQATEEGEGTISFILRSSILNERLTEQVTVERPLIAEAFTTVGVIDDGEDDNRAVEGVIIPSAITEGYGSLDLRLSSSLRPLMLPAVEEIIIPVYRYSAPYSTFHRIFDLNLRMLGYGSGGYHRNSILSVLSRNQFENGGIGHRSPDAEYSRPDWLLSLLFAHTLQTADETGSGVYYDADRGLLMQYLLNEFNRALSGRDVERRGFLLAWTASVLQREGKIGLDQLEQVAALEDNLGIAGYNILAETFLRAGDMERASDLHRRSRNFVNIGTQSVDVKQSYEVRSYFASMEMETALMLRTATLLDVDSEYLLRLAGSLSRTRNARRFHSMFDSYFMVLGFEPILQRETSDPDMQAAAVLNGEELINERLADQNREQDFTSFSLFEQPLSLMPRNQLLEMEISKSGEGPLYYTSIFRYALPVESALPRDEGIEVISRIETLDGNVIEGEVLPLGETLRMRIFLNTPRRLSFLTLNVPVPSGAEILDPNLEVTGSYIEAGGLQSEEWERETVYGDTATFVAEGYVNPWWWDYWFYRPIQRYYASSISYTWEDFYAGSREVSFLLRTTTPGVYPTPPIQATLEFEPEIFGRTGGRLFVISSGADEQE
jgi:uncharacterized protein YfaS (alpha-2-macroglobulin family)